MSCDPLADFDHEVHQFLQSAGVDPSLVRLEPPRQREFGERATSVAFRLARERKRSPQEIASEIAARFDPAGYRFIAAVEPAGAGFLNFRLSYSEFIPHFVEAVTRAGALYGRSADVDVKQVVVEHTSVNPNKEWHIGHARNASIGDTLARILALHGHSVQVQNYIDDTGLQAAQALEGLLHFPEPRRPDEKYDHYVGRLYVKVAAELGSEPELRKQLEDATDEEQRSILRIRLENIERLQKLAFRTMHELESGRHHEQISRILDAQLETAYRLGVFYNLLNWESHLVQSQTFQQAMERIAEAPTVTRPPTGKYAGALVIETGPPPKDSDEPKSEVLIRSNGIPTYVAKDIAYHMWKFGLLPDRMRYVEYAIQPNGEVLCSTAVEGPRRDQPKPDEVINVIAVNQTLAQDAVRESLRVSGFDEAADHLIHLAYGLVSTPEGRISGRRGTSVSADAVVEEAVRVAYERVQEKRTQDLTADEMRLIAEAVGVGAVRYFMVQYNPLTDVEFKVADVVSYDGNTGLYIQYALVRMFAILRKARDELGISEAEIDAADPSLLGHDQERRLVLHMAQLPDTIATAARTLAVNLVAEFAYDLATTFSQFYRDCPVLTSEPALRAARLLLVKTTRDVLVNACTTLGVPVIDRL